MQDQLKKIRAEALAAIAAAKDKLKLAELENRFLGRKSGELTNLLKVLKDLAEDSRKEMGALANEVKTEVEAARKKKKQELDQAEWASTAEAEAVDVTQPVLPPAAFGHLHPNTIVQSDLEDLFTSMGFMIL